jgi:hypothetical protein
MKYYAIFDTEGNRLTTYVDEIHGDNIPKEAIEITAEEQNLYCTNEYIRDENGRPKKKPVYVPTNEELLSQIRAKRNQLLSECDWTQLPDISLTEEQKTSWKQYRQALRDMPTTCDVQNPIYPTKPE